MEPRVVHHVELRADMPSNKVSDFANCASVVCGHLKVLSSASSRDPFGKLLSVLKLWLKDIAGTSKNLRIFEKIKILEESDS